MAVETTQRAYTLRLRGDEAAMDALWQTHVAVNRGVKVFGDWLLTLRGGLDHRLADEKVKVKSKDDKESFRAPTPDEVRSRRIVLALSWLSVESKDGAPGKHVVPPDKTIATLKGILQKRGLKQGDTETWVTDCADSLSAAIRDDAVWVNRSAAFDAAARTVGKSLTRNEVWDALGPYFVDAPSYLFVASASDDDSEAVREDKAKDLVQKAGQWLSSRFGEGEGADFSGLSRAYQRIADAADGLRAGVSGSSVLARLAERALPKPQGEPLDALLDSTSAPGHKSATRNILKRISTLAEVDRETLDRLAEVAAADAAGCGGKVDDKGHRPYADRLLQDVERECGMTYLQHDGPARHWEFAVMLDHAARRLSVAHSWQKLAEARRQTFAADARRTVPADVAAWLDRFVVERSGLSGAVGSVQIRRRAIDGWDDVVKAWSRSDCKSEDDRRQAVRELQDELEKFGDAYLFESLATDDAKCVWLRNGEPDPVPLRDYVLAHDSEAKMRRFKVPAYRHPHPLLHPVFCDFGKSRWSISFALHAAAAAAGKAEAAVTERQKELAACTKQKDKPKAEARLLKARKEHDEAAASRDAARSDRGLTLKLWSGTAITPLSLTWQSKRLAADLALRQTEADGVGVSRADRAGRAAVGAATGPVSILNVFAEELWNGRLQAPRAQLDRLAARVEKHGWDKKAESQRRRIEWLVSFSPRLQVQDNGPWPAYVEGMVKSGRAEPFSRKTAKGTFVTSLGWPHSIENEKRKGQARLDLCRLPGLRILSIDLGHRYAAASAVWETLTDKQMAKLCDEAGRKRPDADTLAVHLLGMRNGKKVKTIFRRTGPDMWARLDRQFLIKLQGEDESPRKASDAERGAVAAMETGVGRLRQDDAPLPWQIRDLMAEALRTARLALRRHGDRARVAFNLVTQHKPMPGGGSQELTDEARRELLTDTLMLWQNLFSGDRWQDPTARRLWDEHIGVALPAMPDEGASGPARRTWEKQVRELLPEVADKLGRNPQLCRKLNAAWTTRWLKDDREWKPRLRWLRNWLLPHGDQAGPSVRHVGGLSLDRLSNIRELYQLMKAYRTRPEPDDPRKNVPARGDSSLDKYGQRILDALDRMRDNRVKQLASRIAEAALGIGRENGCGEKRPQARVFEPCHAIVVENLERYRPEQTRTRRENRQLMRWSAAKVGKCLNEACELNGLLLRNVMPNYTSRQDSRTGAAGARCTDLPVAEFLRRFGPKAVALRKEKDATSKYLVELVDHWQKRSAAEQESGIVRIPQDGGELFVSTDPQSPAAKGLQADLNAAANIGLRALLDPDWPGKWWWIPCGRDGKPDKEKCKGTAAFKLDARLLPEATGKGKDIVNAWRDVSAARIGPEQWQGYSEYWNGIKARVVDVLRRQAGLA